MNKRIRKKKLQARVMAAIEKADNAVCFVKNKNSLVSFIFCGNTGYVTVVPSDCAAREVSVCGYCREVWEIGR